MSPRVPEKPLINSNTNVSGKADDNLFTATVNMFAIYCVTHTDVTTPKTSTSVVL